MKLFTLKDKRHMPTWLAGILAFIIKLISLTYRVTYDDPHECFVKLQPWPFVLSLWHNRILFTACFVRKAILQKMTVLISNSRDGEYVSTFIRFFGLNVVRGSSSKGGAQALIDLMNEIRKGQTVILTLDGPRGPKYTIHPGAIAIAQRESVPILPLSVNAKSYWQLKSWDNTQIPKPFTKVTFKVGTPLYIPADLPMEDAEKLVKDAMMAVTVDREEPEAEEDFVDGDDTEDRED